MDYSTMNQLKGLMENQIKFLDYMDALIAYDKEQAEAHPEKDQPPIAGVGLLKSHFMTQKKACEAVIALTDRHLPDLKAVHDAEQEKKKAEQKARTANRPASNPTKPPSSQVSAAHPVEKVKCAVLGMNLFEVEGEE